MNKSITLDKMFRSDLQPVKTDGKPRFIRRFEGKGFRYALSLKAGLENIQHTLKI